MMGWMKMDYCPLCKTGYVRAGHKYCRDCEQEAAKMEQQLSLEGEWQ